MGKEYEDDLEEIDDLFKKIENDFEAPRQQ